jgi:hypothetical protein
MYIVAHGNGALLMKMHEQDDSEAEVDYTWQVLMCPVCQQINVVRFTRYESEAYFSGCNEHGEELYDQQVHIDYLHPLFDPSLPSPHPDMPDSLRNDYGEAYRVCTISPRSAAALLRLMVQKLCNELVGVKGGINENIKILVQRGLPEHIQEALDTVRIIGNQAVHPDELDVDDNPETVRRLFNLVNEIVEDRISRPSKQAEISRIYGELPPTKLDEIRQRDVKPKTNS